MTTTSPGARVVVDGLTIVTSGLGARVVDDVAMQVAAGEVLGVVGESGSGKTTLGLAMIGHVRRGLRFGAGTIRLDGTDLRSLSPERLRRLRGSAMAYVPQDPSTALNPTMRVGAQLREALAVHGRTGAELESRIADVLAEVGLQARPGLLSAYPHQLSGGQQQRVAIAMAFACRPGLIVLDEPTTGLDVTTQRTVLDTVADMCSAYGVAAVYVSHDVAVVGELAHRVAVLYAGRIIEAGPTTEVFGAPVHPYTKGLLRAVPSPERSQRLVGMEGVPPRPGQRTSGCAFEPRCPVRIERCRVELPDLSAVGPAHQARCLLVEQRAGTAAAFPVEVLPHQPTAAPGVQPALVVDRLNASYGSTPVLLNIAVAVRPNSCVAIVGESGSGKTTLARCISGLHSNWTGEIGYAGRPLPAGIRRRSRDALRGIQYIFQNPYASLNPRRTVGQLIAEPLEHFARPSARDRDAQVFDAIRSVSLPEGLVDRYPDQLSGGERQRVAIARTLVVSPQLLICDEVTSALDVSVQAAVVELLRRLQRERGLAMLFITHNLALVRSIAQEVVVMQSGRIVEAGPVELVLERPREAYTKRLLEHVPKFEDAWRKRSGA